MAADKDALDKMAYELSYYESMAKNLQHQVELLSQSLQQALATQSAIRALSGSKGAAIFPLGSRVFVRAAMEGDGKLLVDAGAGVIVEKTFEEADADLEANIGKIREGLDGTQKQLSDITQRASQLNEAVEQLAARTRENGPR